MTTAGPSTAAAVGRFRLTDVVGGGAVVIGGVIWLLGALFVRVPVVMWGPAPGLIRAILIAAGMTILAIGVGGEAGITRRPLIGRVSLIVFGVQWLAIQVLVDIEIQLPDDSVQVVLNTALTVLFACAGIVSAWCVLRVRVLPLAARAVFLVGTIVIVVVTMLPVAVPSLGLGYILAVAHADAILAIAVIVLGLAALAPAARPVVTAISGDLRGRRP